MTTPLLQPASVAALVYFIPNGAKAPGYLAGGPLARKNPAEGPRGTADVPPMGELVSPLAGGASLEVLGSGQTWTPVDGGPVMLGLLDGATILPEQIARMEQRNGHTVRLGDGNEWMIPVARLASGGTGLPKRRVFGTDGQPVWQVEAAFSGLSAFAEKIWTAFVAGAGVVTDEELDRWCGEALSVNYRMSTTEAIALGLFTDESMVAIARALIDWPTVLAMAGQKKSQPGG